MKPDLFRFAMIALVIICLSLAAQAAPLAILTDVSGSVQVVRGGKSSTGRNGAQLQAGDVVRVAKGSATIYFATRAPQKVAANQQVRISASAATSRPSPWRNVYAGLSQGFSRQRQGTATVRPGTIEFIAPAGLISTAHPIFQWSLNQIDPTAVSDYLLTIKDASGQTVWETATTSLITEYSADAPELKSGQKYLWSVAGRQEDELLGLKEINSEWISLTAAFRIATPDEMTEALEEQSKLSEALKDAPESTRRLSLAAALAERGLWTDAIALLLPSLSRRDVEQGTYRAKLDELLPQLDEAARVLLRSLFLETGQNTLANKLEVSMEEELDAKKKENPE